MRFLGSIDQIAALVQHGITTVGKIAALIRKGKAEITTAAGQVVSAEDLKALVKDVIATAGQTGDEAAGRVAGRHP